MATFNINGDLSDKNFNDLPKIKADDVVKVTITAKVVSYNREGFPGYDSGQPEGLQLGNDGSSVEIETPSLMYKNPVQNVFVHARDLK